MLCRPRAAPYAPKRRRPARREADDVVLAEQLRRQLVAAAVAAGLVLWRALLLDAVRVPEDLETLALLVLAGTAANDPKGRPTIYDRLPPGLPRVMPVGRLDFMTEGLLLLTNDGALKRRLELPATAG